VIKASKDAFYKKVSKIRDRTKPGIWLCDEDFDEIGKKGNHPKKVRK